MPAFVLNTSTNCSKILKWKAGVISFRLTFHFSPVPEKCQEICLKYILVTKQPVRKKSHTRILKFSQKLTKFCITFINLFLSLALWDLGAIIYYGKYVASVSMIIEKRIKTAFFEKNTPLRVVIMTLFVLMLVCCTL
jgi:hypothetical protein